MQLTDEGIALIKRFEGCELTAYQDSAGVWTIGYGHAATSGRHPIPHKGMTISQAQAERIFEQDMQHFAVRVQRLLTRKATPTQFSALVSLAFNIGIGAFSASTALKRFNAGDLEGAAEALQWWNKATVNGKKKVLRGLVRRRTEEAAMLLSESAPLPARETPTPERQTPAKSTTLQASGAAAAGAATAAGTAVGQLDGTAQIVVIVAAVVVGLAVLWIVRERLRKWAAGDR